MDEKFDELLESLAGEDELKTLILDLRGNDGGIIDAAAAVAQRIIGRGVVYYRIGRDGSATPRTVFGGQPASFRTVVLVDGFTASAAEMLAGALRDRAGAVLIGETTFGKGTMQNVFPLSNGAGLAITIAELLTPNKHHYHEIGLEPDVPVEGALPQLLAGMREAVPLGGTLTLKVSAEGEAEAGGMRLEEPLPWFAEGGSIYLPLRVLAALTGAGVGWRADNGGEAVVYRDDGETVVYSERLGNFVIRKGTGYADAKLFPQIDVQSDGEGIVIKYLQRPQR